jgi:hypothetical protein
LLIDGVDDDRSSAEFTAASDAPAKPVDEEMSSELLALFGPGDGQPREQHHGHRIGHAPPEAGGSMLMANGVHGQGVIAHHATIAAQRIRSRGAGRRRNTGGSLEPPVEFGHPAVEPLDHMVTGGEFDRPQRLQSHRVGIGLRFLA